MSEAFAKIAPAASWRIAPWTRATISFALIVIGLIALFFDAAASMASQWIHSSAYHHGAAVAPIALWLIVRREDWRTTQPNASWLGVAIVIVAALVWLVGRAANVDVVGHGALVLALIGAVVAAYGRRLAALWAFPLAFLFFMVPFGEEATPILQEWAAKAVAAVLNLTGVETARDGFMLTTSAGRFEMAQACAGLRFLLAAAMISSLVAYLAFATWRKRVAFVAAALALAVIANWARAYIIVAIATATDGLVGTGPEHVALGWVFYSALIIGLLLAAQRFRDANAGDGPEPAPAQIFKTSQGPAAAALIAAALVALYDSLVVSATIAVAGPASLLPISAEGFRETAPSLEWRASVANADRFRTARLVSDDAEILTSVAWFAYDRPNAEIVGSDVRAADGAEWRRVAVGRMPVSEFAAPVVVETIQNQRGERLDVARFYWLGDKAYANAAAVKLRVAAAKLIGRREPGGAIFVAAAHEANADPHVSIAAFLAKAEPISDWSKRIEAR